MNPTIGKKNAVVETRETSEWKGNVAPKIGPMMTMTSYTLLRYSTQPILQLTEVPVLQLNQRQSTGRWLKEQDRQGTVWHSKASQGDWLEENRKEKFFGLIAGTG